MPTIVIEAGGTFDGRSHMAGGQEDENANTGKTELEGADETHGAS